MRMLLGLLMLALVFGCIGNAPVQAPQNQTQQAPPQPLQPQWEHFSGVYMGFDYPGGMNVSVTNSSMPSSGTVLVQSSDAAKGAILVTFANVSGAVSQTEDPLALAAGILEYENSSGSDNILSQAEETGAISNYTSPNGLAVAEMPFVLVSGNTTLYGFAMEMISIQNTAAYPVRVLSSDPNQTRVLRDRFVSSFTSG